MATGVWGLQRDYAYHGSCDLLVVSAWEENQLVAERV
jgi:hypothetical protein